MLRCEHQPMPLVAQFRSGLDGSERSLLLVMFLLSSIKMKENGETFSETLFFAGPSTLKSVRRRRARPTYRGVSLWEN
jgi:hypothetical protein